MTLEPRQSNAEVVVDRPALLHIALIDRPSRTLCGRSRNPADPMEPYQDGPLTPDDCVVCAELGEAFVAGRWEPSS